MLLPPESDGHTVIESLDRLSVPLLCPKLNSTKYLFHHLYSVVFFQASVASHWVLGALITPIPLLHAGPAIRLIRLSKPSQLRLIGIACLEILSFFPSSNGRPSLSIQSARLCQPIPLHVAESAERPLQAGLLPSTQQPAHHCRRIQSLESRPGYPYTRHQLTKRSICLGAICRHL